MGKKLTKVNTILIIGLMLFSFLLKGGPSLAQHGAEGGVSGQSLIFTPSVSESSVTDREQRALEREYRHRVRHKDIILSPYVSAPGEVELTPLEYKELAEQEKLYRYFGIASDLYKAGRLEEAVEILKYILHKNPDDEYVKSYLRRLQNELKIKNTKWQRGFRKKASALRKVKLKDLLKEGTTYYKQKRYDVALLRFADALTLDPDNSTAKAYMDKLKRHYLREVRVEAIVEAWGTDRAEAGKELLEEPISSETKQAIRELLDRIEHSQNGITAESEHAIERLLDKTEYEVEGITPQVGHAAEQLLDEREMEQVIVEKKAGALLEQAELGFRVEDIIARKRKEERRLRQFTVGAGDVIQISVRDHPELSGRAKVGVRGEVILPLTNDIVMVKGLSIDELNEVITEKMKRYVSEPSVSVTIAEYKSKVFYVIDETGCTPYNITRANFTLRDALFTADWGSNRALGRVLVMRPSKFHPIVKKVDAFDIIYRGKLANNIRIDNGDVIYVPMTAVGKTTAVLDDIINPMGKLREAYDKYMDLKHTRWEEVYDYKGGKRKREGWDEEYRLDDTNNNE